MKRKPFFSKRFFERDYPKLLKLTDSEGNQPAVVVILCQGMRIPLKEFELTDEGLFVNISSEKYLITYSAIMSVQVMPQALRKIATNSEFSRIHSQGVPA
jgi:hypothetical protein